MNWIFFAVVFVVLFAAHMAIERRLRALILNRRFMTRAQLDSYDLTKGVSQCCLLVSVVAIACMLIDIVLSIAEFVGTL